MKRLTFVFTSIVALTTLLLLTQSDDKDKTSNSDKSLVKKQHLSSVFN